jgi:YbbR domain-containing protein
MDSFLRSNNLVRLVAFVLAVILWLVVRIGSQSPETPAMPIDRATEIISGTVDLQYDKDKVSLVGEPPEISVKISGERMAVWQAKIAANRLKFTADARGLGEGIHEVNVTLQGLPPDVIFEPLRAPIRLEANLEQKFRVEPLLDGVQDPGKLAGILFEPKEVSLIGPSSVIQQVNKVSARISPQLFDAPGEKRTVVVSAVNDNGKPVNVSIQPKTVEVVYQPPIESKTFTGLRAEVKGLSEGLKVLLPAEGLSVTLQGLANDLNKLRPEDIKIVIDLTGLPPGSYEREAVISVPDKVKPTHKDPLKVPLQIVSK